MNRGIFFVVFYLNFCWSHILMVTFDILNQTYCHGWTKLYKVITASIKFSGLCSLTVLGKPHHYDNSIISTALKLKQSSLVVMTWEVYGERTHVNRVSNLCSWQPPSLIWIWLVKITAEESTCGHFTLLLRSANLSMNVLISLCILW
jgi:hypothetical protein